MRLVNATEIVQVFVFFYFIPFCRNPSSAMTDHVKAWTDSLQIVCYVVIDLMHIRSLEFLKQWRRHLVTLVLIMDITPMMSILTIVKSIQTAYLSALSAPLMRACLVPAQHYLHS